jgi:type VI secretion system protein ImpB
MADLSGDRDSEKPIKAVKDRKFVEIDRDNFNHVMVDADPRVALQVPNKLDGTNSTQLNVVLHFNSMDDFDPISIIKQVEPMRALYEARTRLNDLLAKLDGNDDLESLLQNILSNADARNTVKGDIDKAKPKAAPAKKK